MTEPARRVRMDPEERRALLLADARAAFAESGYAHVGLAEIAKRSGVSKTLLYHYWPDGRPQLYLQVMEGLVSDLARSVRRAARGSGSAEQRLQAIVDAFFEFFDLHPEAFALLFREPWGSGEPEIVGQAMAIRVRIATEFTTLLSASGGSLADFMGAATATVGALLNICELWIAGQLEREDAIRVASAYLRGGLHELNLL